MEDVEEEQRKRRSSCLFSNRYSDELLSLDGTFTRQTKLFSVGDGKRDMFLSEIFPVLPSTIGRLFWKRGEQLVHRVRLCR